MLHADREQQLAGAIERGNRTNRRRALALTAITGTAIVAGRTVTVAHADANEPLVGSWAVAATPPGGPQRLLASFFPGGVAVRTAPLQQAAPAGLGVAKMFISTTHGVWERVNDTGFGLTFIGFAFDQAGNFLATQRIRVVVEVSDSGDAFTGPFKTDFVGADGNVLASVNGTVQGSRIVVETPA